MKQKTCFYAVCCIGLYCTFIAYAMDNNQDNQAIPQPNSPSLLPQLPRELIEHIGTFLDSSSLAAFRKSCRHCYACLRLTFDPSNSFRALPPQALACIAHNCTQKEWKRIWCTNKFLYKHFIDPERPLILSFGNYFPYYSQRTPTHTLIMHIGEVVAVANRRGLQIKLDLSNQSLRPGIDRIAFLPRLVERLKRLRTLNAVVDLDLSRNFLKDFPLYLTHNSLNLKPATTADTITAINTICAHATNIVTLALNGNDLTTLPDGIAHLQKLRTLLLAWNNLESGNITPLCTSLPALTELDLTRNFLKTIPQELYQIPTLRILTLNGNPLNEEALRQLQKNCSQQLTIQFDGNP